MTGRALTARMGLVLCVFAWTLPARAQENFEIQVYGSETVAPGDTMVELHSNVAAEGSRRTVNGVLRTQGAFHETLEITQGITSWLETGFYVFTSIQPDTTWEWVGDHIRPRVRAPESWELPVGLSLSAELGYQRRAFSTDTWTLELRPIVDRQWNRWYVSINPTLDRAIKGESVDRGFEFSPAAKVSYNVAPKVAIGLEYYGALGPVTHFDRAHDQQHQLFPVIDLDLGPRWEFNAGGRLRTHPEHRPVHCQDDPWLPLQLGRRGAQVALVSSPFGAGGMARKSLSGSRVPRRRSRACSSKTASAWSTSPGCSAMPTSA